MTPMDGAKVYPIVLTLPESPAKAALIAEVVNADVIAQREELPHTDLGNARRLIRDHGNDLRYVAGLGWIVWDCRRWAPDVDGAVLRRAKQTIDSLYQLAVDDLAKAGNIGDATERRARIDQARARLTHALKSQGEPRLRAMVSLAESELEVIAAAADLDQPPLLLCTPGGTVELTDGTLREHRRADLLTRMTAVTPDPDAIAPRWKQFLREIMASDETRIAYLQRSLGYAITGLTREQKIFLFLGDGRNGKTTLGQIVVSVLGDYAAEMDFGSFVLKEGRNTRGDLIRLRGKRTGFAAEINPGERLDTRLIKSWVGGEAFVGAEKYKSEISFRPITKLFLLCNHVPVVHDSSEGAWRRFVRFPFVVKIPDGQVDLEIEGKLLAEAPGIMQWLLDGCRAYLREGLGEDPLAKAATAAWRAESDQVGRWIGTVTELVPGEKAARRTVRASYVKWCEAESEREMGTKAFAEELRRHGVADGGTMRLDGKPVSAWSGIRLLEPGDCRGVEAVAAKTPNPHHEGRVLELYPEQPSTSHYVTTEREPGEDDNETTGRPA
jgi:putative DNA primase/helicase